MEGQRRRVKNTDGIIGEDETSLNGDGGTLPMTTHDKEDFETLIQRLHALLNESCYSPCGWFEKYTRYSMTIGGHVTELCLKKLYSWISDTESGPVLSTVRLTQLTIGVILQTEIGQFHVASDHLSDLDIFVRTMYRDLSRAGQSERAMAYKYVLLTTQAYFALFVQREPMRAKERITKAMDIDIRVPATASMLLVFHAQFIHHLVPAGTDTDRLKDLKLAVELDGLNVEAKHYLLRVLRKARRDLGRHGETPPSREEINMANDIVRLGLKYVRPEGQPSTTFSQMEPTTEEQGPSADYNSNGHSLSISTRVSKALRMSNLSEAEAEFRYLLQAYPQNSEVLHKAGSFFTRRFNPRDPPRYYTFGLDLIRQSVLNNADINFSGLFEWMDKKWRSEGLEGVEDILDLADQCLQQSPTTSKIHTSQLQLAVGALLWSTNERNSAFKLFTDTILEYSQQALGEHGLLTNWLAGERILRSLLSLEKKRELLQGFLEYLQSQLHLHTLKNSPEEVKRILLEAMGKISFVLLKPNDQMPSNF